MVFCSTTQAASPASADSLLQRPASSRCGYSASAIQRRSRQQAIPSLTPRLFSTSSVLALAIFCCCCSNRLSSVDALVSYCRDTTPSSYSHAQAEVVCELSGQYRFPIVNDKGGGGGHRLYEDLGGGNRGKRYAAMTLDESIVAKYANMSEYVLHVQVLSANTTTALHHCCKVCYLDCEQFRNECPRRNVPANDSCPYATNENELCRFTESVLDVRARLVCAIKASTNRAIPDAWYTSTGFTMRTSPPGCPYRGLENGAYYLVMATLATPSQGGGDELVGADMIVALPKKLRGQPPATFLRGMDLRSSGFNYLLNSTSQRNDSRCPDRRSLAARSRAAIPTMAREPSGSLKAKALAAAAVAAAIVGVVTWSSADAVNNCRAVTGSRRRVWRTRPSCDSGNKAACRCPAWEAAVPTAVA